MSAADGLELARELGRRFAAEGATHGERWKALAAVAERDVALARVVEPHLDALGILAEAGASSPGTGADAERTWGVWAAEGGDEPLRARPDGSEWLLDGVKPWCSLADEVGCALVTAWVDDDRRGLFRVEFAGTDEQRPGQRHAVERLGPPWVSRGLAEIPSPALRFRSVRACAVGAPGWYLERPGFPIGGIGVAACWLGGVRPLARRVLDHVAARAGEPGELETAALGRIDLALAASAALLEDAAHRLDAAGGDRAAAALAPAALTLLASRVRASIASTVRLVLGEAEAVLGPAPFAREEVFAKRAEDLRMYVRQEHGDRDAAGRGRLLLGALADGEPPW